VPDARLPGTDGLAEGSAGMVATQLAYSRDSRLPVEVANSIGMRFRLVPPGTAIIGSPEPEWGRGDIEVPHVVVFTEPVYMGKFEVTQAEYLEVMGENPSGFIGGNRPVEEVTWYDAQRFLVELAKREGIPDKVYRLPDEAEWEYACRAGTQTAFCFGDSPDRLGEYADTALNNFKSTAPVGRRLPNALGLFDMHGNVWEWCRDLFRPYPGGPAVGEEYLEWRSLRGGHWRAPADSCRSANRCRLAPTSHGNVLGFRVLRRIPELFETPPEPDPAEAGTKDSDG
jgi:formylglycine-generating enzyme required for sulfatase activity